MKHSWIKRNLVNDPAPMMIMFVARKLILLLTRKKSRMIFKEVLLLLKFKQTTLDRQFNANLFFFGLKKPWEYMSKIWVLNQNKEKLSNVDGLHSTSSPSTSITLRCWSDNTAIGPPYARSRGVSPRP